MSKLRLLLLTDAVGGVWVYSLELARALQPLGVEAVLAVVGPAPSSDQRTGAAGVQLIETGLPLEWLDTSADEILHAGEKIARIVDRESVDLVQTSSAALIAGAALGCPSIAVQHSCVATWWAAVKGTPLPPEFQWRRELVGRGLRRAEAVVAPTRAFADQTQRAYALDRPVIAIENGRTARELRPLPQGDFVLTVGRLWDEGKNAATLDRAAGWIRAPFQAAGSTGGPNGASIAFEHLIALGALSENRIAGVLAARPIYASAALYEPFGLSVLEAAQAGCALVLSDIATHRELWDGAALFADPRDPRAFAGAANRLLEDRSFRNQLGERARQRAGEYAPERMAMGMAALYARVAQPQLIAGAA